MKQSAPLNAIFYVLVVLVNYLANALPLAGNTTGEVSALYDNLFVPAGYTFSIWGLIYLTLGIFIVRAILPNRSSDVQLATKNIGPWLIINFIGNIFWLILWHYKMIGLSVIVMAVLLISLVAIYIRLDNPKMSMRSGHWWSVKGVFSLYLGWILVASIANGSAFLNYHDLDFGIDPSYWLTAMLVISALFGVFFLGRFKDPVPALVIIWAFGGIYAKYQTRIGVPDFPLTFIAALTLSLSFYTIWVILFSPHRSS